jgi:plastocyanin
MNKNKLFLSVFISFFLVLPALQPTARAAVVSGKVLFEGQAPVEKIKLEADPNCQVMHPDGIASDEVIVNSNGTLKDVFIYVKEGVGGKTFETPKTPVVFDQKGCQYSPKVFGIRVNQPLEILNSDNTLHNVHSLAQINQAFNLGMPIQGMKLKKTFTKSEVMVKVKCEVHPWMHAYVGVLDHPFFAVSNEGGTFEIKNLPPGQYVIEAWHAKYGSQVQNVTVASDSDTQNISFQYKA